MTAGQYLDWEQFHRQFNLAFERNDLHWGLLLSMYYNSHKSEGAFEKSPADMMPYYDQYADDDAFIQAMQGIAASIRAEAGAAEKKE